MTERLAKAGVLHSDAWRTAVEQVPRHAFLRGGYFERADTPGPTAWRPVLAEDPHWLEGCYREEESLVTQIAGTIVPRDVRGEILRTPTSSSTMPRLVLRMLEDLHVEDGHRLLWIGTGTGYPTALACHRLGEQLVTAVDVDGEVNDRARTALGECGFFPEVVTGDGLAGHPRGAPYDRVIASCGVLDVPHAWMEQARPGALIVATVCGWLYASELARLTVGTDGTATGSFLGGKTSFMLARPHLPPPLGMLPDFDRPDEERPARLAPDVLGDWNTRFVAQIAAPRTQRIELGDGRTLLLDVVAGAWAVLWDADGRTLVRQGGPQRLWDRIEDHVERWRADGAPSLERFTLTVGPGFQRIIWPSR